ncbi:sensor histidine kinase [Paenibacillus chungangensis]|uniref:histidine kinase n=1 Tax=Paenibacillus chungangensis TaxID=696535 RepID=A0ABW3HP93_9BACL
MKAQLMNGSIKRKIMIAFAALVLLPITVLCSYFYYQTNQYIQSQIVSNSSIALSQAKANVVNKMNIVTSASDHIAFNDTLRNFLSEEFIVNGDSMDMYREKIVPLLKYGTYFNQFNIHNIALYVSNVTIPEGYGVVWHISALRSQEWYQKFMQSDMTTQWWSHEGVPIDHSGIVGAIYTYAHKIHSMDGEFLGIVAVDILQKDLFSFLTGASEEAYTFVLDPSRGAFMQQRSDIFRWHSDKRQAEMTQSLQGSFRYEDSIVVYSDLPALDVLLGIMVESAYGASFKLFAATLAIIGVCIISILLFYKVIKMLFTLFKKSISAMDHAIDTGLPLQLPLDRKDEFGVIADKFNTLLLKIQHLMREMVQKELLHKDTQLKALQYQINPHFIYNTIDIFSAKMELAGQYDVSEAFSDFGKILRYTIDDPTMYTTLECEIDHLSRYANLQKMKYGDRLRVLVDIPDELLSACMITFILQPLVENSIKHGFGDRDKLEVVIEAKLIERRNIQITISDNGNGMRHEQVDALNTLFIGPSNRQKAPEQSVGIGLRNINERLKLFYGDHYHLTMESKLGTGTVTSIKIPWREKEW